MNKKKLISFGLLLVASFVALNVAVFLLSSAQVFDISGNRKYTLNENTLTWLKNNQQNLYFRLYQSEGLNKSDKELAAYAAYVLKLLEQYQINSHHKIGLQLVDVVPFSVQENEARSLGIKEIRQPNSSKTNFLGLVISDAKGNMRTIPYLNPLRQNYLEQDISRMMTNLEAKKRLDVGILSPAFKVMASDDSLDYTPNWPFVEALARDYTLTYIKPNIGQIPLNVEVLLVINPLELPNTTLYAIDQFLLFGGKVIMLLDPFSEYMLANQIMPREQISQSYLLEFLENLGISYNPSVVISDNHSARMINQNGKMQPYPFWLGIDSSRFSRSSITNGVGMLHLNSAGALDVSETDGIKKTILFATNSSSGEVSAAELANSNNKQALKSFVATAKEYPLAVLLEGKFNSYFRAPYLQPINEIPFISISLETSKLLVVADSDMLLSSNFNNNKEPEQAWFDMVPNSGNLDFLINAIDIMSGSQNPLNVAKRADSYGKQSLALAFYTKAYQLLEPVQMQKLAELKQTEDALQQISIKLSYNELIPSLKVTQEVENLERRKQQIQKELRELEYLLNQRYQQETNIFVMQNMALALLLLLITLGVQLLLEKRTAKLAKGYADE